MKIKYIDKPGLELSCIVDVSDLDCPLPKDVVWGTAEFYDTKTGHTRDNATYKNYSDVTAYFTKLIRNYVLPLVREKSLAFKKAYPYTLESLIENLDIGVTLHRDNIGWNQDAHEDPRMNVMAGTIHLQDSDGGGTLFHGNNIPNSSIPDATVFHTAPSQKFSGSFWFNTPNSYHSVPKVINERVIYLLHVRWKTVKPLIPDPKMMKMF